MTARSVDFESFKDAVLIALALMALCVEVTILLGQMRLLPFALPWLSDEIGGKPVGFVQWEKHGLRDRPRGSLTWYPRVAGDAIHLDDTIMTSNDSSARIQIAGRGAVELGPDTLIQISNHDGTGGRGAFGEILELEIDEGQVQLAATSSEGLKVKIREREIQLKAGTAITISQTSPLVAPRISVQRGEAQIGKRTLRTFESQTEDEKSSLRFALKEGEAIVLNSGPLKIEREREIAQVARRIEIPIKVSERFPADKTRFVATHEGVAEIHFSWIGDGGSVEIDDSSAFSHPKLLRAKAPNDPALARLPPGEYFWRVRSTAFAEKHGEQQSANSTSDSFALYVLPDPDYSPIGPYSKRKIKLGTPIILEWKEVPGAVDFEVEISRLADFSTVLLTERVKENRFTAPALSAGAYFWRVRARHSRWGEWPASPAFAFSVRKPVSAPKLKGFRILMPNLEPTPAPRGGGG